MRCPVKVWREHIPPGSLSAAGGRFDAADVTDICLDRAGLRRRMRKFAAPVQGLCHKISLLRHT